MPILALFKSLSLTGKILSIALPILAILSILGSVYYIGYSKGKNLSNIAIEKYKTRISQLESAKSQEQTKINTKIVVQYKDRIQTIEKVVYKNNDIIKEVPSIGNLTNGWIYLHNQASQGQEADLAKSKDSTISTISDVKALGTISENYGQCLKWKADNQAWIDWYNQTKINYEKDIKK